MMKKKLSLSDSNHLLNITLGILLVFLTVWVLYIGKSIILPLLLAVFLSFILDPIVNLLQKIKIPLTLSVLLTLIFVFVLMYLFGLLVYSNAQMFVIQFPVYQEQLLQSLGSSLQKLEQRFGESFSIVSIKQIDWISYLKSFSVAQGVLTSLGTFITFIVKMLIVIVFIAFLLTGKRNINQKIQHAFQPDQATNFINIMENIIGQIQKYLGAKTVTSVITGFISIIIFYLFGLDFAIFWGFLIFLFNFVPNIGSIVASLLPVLFSFLQMGSLSTSLWLGISLLILQFSAGNILEPKIMGRSLNLSPMVVILSLIFWGYLWGIGGMLLAVPILATITIIFENVRSLRFLAVFLRGKVK